LPLGFVSQPRTWAVTSTVIQSPATLLDTVFMIEGALMVRGVLWLTLVSDHAEAMADTLNAPWVDTLSTQSSKVALEIELAVALGGKMEAKLKRSSDKSPLPTLSVGFLPKLLAGREDDR
jgi:hypothetical protein